MPKTVRNRRNQPDSDTPEAALEVVGASPAVEEEPRQAAQPNHDDDDEELDLAPPDDDDEDDDGPAPRGRRPAKKRGRRPAADAPITFADVVNDPALNWQEHRVVVYRKTVTKDMKAVMKANSGRTWIDQIAGPFDEEFGEAYLRKHYGGGVFSVYLQEKVAGSKKWDELMEAEYAIAGPAKYTEEEAAAYNKMNPQQGAAPSGERSEMGMLVDILQRQIDKADASSTAPLQALVDSMRMGQQASTQMLMETVQKMNEVRSAGRGNEESDKTVQLLLAMLERRLSAPAPAPEPQKTGLQQIEEFVRLQRLINEAVPKPAPGPMDKLAEMLMARAVESIVPGAEAPAAAARETWWQSLLKPLASNLPALVTGVGSFLSQQAQVRQQILREELQARRIMIREQMAAQRGEALPPVTDTPPLADDPARRQQEQQQVAQAAVMESFIGALTSEYFAREDPEDTAVTLSAAFPQVVAGLQQQLGPLGEWWKNPDVMGRLASLYPGMRPLLSHPKFPDWIAQVWEHLKPEEPEQEAEQAADTAQS